MFDIDGNKRFPGWCAIFDQKKDASRRGNIHVQLTDSLEARFLRPLRRSFSGIALFSFGFLSAFPVLPNIDAGSFSMPPTEETARNEQPAGTDVCAWKKDAALFSSLSADEQRVEKEVTCIPEAEEGPVSGTVPAEEPGNNASASQAALDAELEEMVSGYPLEAMIPAISRYDRTTAGLIVGIAKKESDWGKHVPTKNGQDCYNYWGYKGAGSRGTAMGHGCFGSPEEAVQTIGNRLEELIAKRHGSDPAQMIVWKCGSSCATHSSESVRKWISDVNIYYRQIAAN